MARRRPLWRCCPPPRQEGHRVLVDDAEGYERSLRYVLTPEFGARNPLTGIELPPNDEKPRTRVADADEAAALIAALDPADAVRYALAFYSGLRRAEIKRLDWPDVELDGYRMVVRKAKSRAGTGRRPPIAEPLRPILLGEFMRQGRRAKGRRECGLSHVRQNRRTRPEAMDRGGARVDHAS